MIILAVIWTVWCVFHSLLISSTAHNTAKVFLGEYFSLYRILYVGFSFITLVPVLWYQFSLPQNVIVPGNYAIWIFQAFLLIYSLFMFYAGARVYDMGYFLGLRQWQDFRLQKEAGSLPFHTEGILNYVRHPWYSGGIALLWGVGSCTDVYLVSRSILTVYIIVGTFLEEKRLKEELGRQYSEYCQRVPMLVPWKRSPLSLFGETWKKS